LHCKYPGSLADKDKNDLYNLRNKRDHDNTEHCAAAQSLHSVKILLICHLSLLNIFAHLSRGLVLRWSGLFGNFNHPLSFIAAIFGGTL